MKMKQNCFFENQNFGGTAAKPDIRAKEHELKRTKGRRDVNLQSALNNYVIKKNKLDYFLMSIQCLKVKFFEHFPNLSSVLLKCKLGFKIILSKNKKSRTGQRLFSHAII